MTRGRPNFEPAPGTAQPIEDEGLSSSHLPCAVVASVSTRRLPHSNAATLPQAQHVPTRPTIMMRPVILSNMRTAASPTTNRSSPLAASRSSVTNGSDWSTNGSPAPAPAPAPALAPAPAPAPAPPRRRLLSPSTRTSAALVPAGVPSSSASAVAMSSSIPPSSPSLSTWTTSSSSSALIMAA